MEEYGRFYGWWQGDPIPALPELAGLCVRSARDSPALAHQFGLLKAEFTQRLSAGHQAYIAQVQGETAGYGWVATREADVGELGVVLRLPAGDRYLWDFATLPAWRGRGVYTRLLQAIVRQESTIAGRLWIGHDAANQASERGILRAGFTLALGFGPGPDGHMALNRYGPPERTEAARQLWGL